MVIIFDLDDTLYSELTYVKSSFRAVARYLSEKYCFEENAVFSDLISIFYEKGRTQVFDKVLKKLNVYKKEEVKRCVAVYRNNIPDINLFDEARDILERLSNYPKYVVTDGNVLVQTRKINALAVNKYFKKIFYTHRFGIKHAKPSTYCFNLIKNIEQCNWENLVYVADDPSKDFVELNRLGVGTVRVHTGRYKDMEALDGYDANIQINRLSELTFALDAETL